MSLIFKKLRNNPGIWRVDGISNIQNSGSKPRCDIRFSKIKDEALKGEYKYQNTLLDTNAEKGEGYLPIDFPFSAIMWFTMGSLWKGGQLVQKASVAHDSVSIDTRTVRNVKLGEKIRLGNQSVHLIQERYYEFGKKDGNFRHLKNNNFALVKVLDPDFDTTEYLIIPHTEIYRFYYGMSSRLCNSIIMGETYKYADITGGKSQRGRSPTLFTSQYLSQLERIVFLRALSNDVAREGLFKSHKILAKEMQQGSTHIDSSSLFSMFPFNGITDLSVAGKKILIKEKDQHSDAIWGRLVTQIFTCRRPFDFINPTIICPYSATAGGNDNLTNITSPVPLQPTFPTLDNEEAEELFDIEDKPANARLKRLALLSPSNRFPDTYNINYEFLNPDRSSNSKLRGLDREEEDEYNTIDEGDYTEDGKGGRGTDQSIEDAPPARSLSDFIKMIKKLRTLGAPNDESKAYGYKVLTHSNDGELTSNGEALSIFPSLGGRFSWYKSENGGNRQVVWAEIKNNTSGKSVHLLEMERRSGEIGKACSTAILIPKEDCNLSEKYVNAFLKFTAFRNFWPKAEYSGSDLLAQEYSDTIFSVASCNKINHLTNVKEYNEELITRWAKNIQEQVMPLTQ